jgi:hypothetical protein
MLEELMIGLVDSMSSRPEPSSGQTNSIPIPSGDGDYRSAIKNKPIR